VGSSDELNPNEGPRHQVTIAKLGVGKYEVTFAEWDTCVAAGGCSKLSDNGWGRDQRPAINVSWDEAQRYVNWLSRLSGAASVGKNTTPKNFLDRKLGEFAWYADNSDSETHPVGENKPNAWGLYDMQGNVWEWVADYWHDNYDGAPSNGLAWVEGDASIRVRRGGSWLNDSDILRPTYRDGSPVGYRNGTLGFRVKRALN